MEEMLATVQRRHENKVADLQTTVDKLFKVGFPHSVDRFYEEGIVLSYIVEENMMVPAHVLGKFLQHNSLPELS